MRILHIEQLRALKEVVSKADERQEISEHEFSVMTRWLNELIRFADEPSAEPPNELRVVYDDTGFPFVFKACNFDLAGTTWRYSNPTKVK